MRPLAVRRAQSSINWVKLDDGSIQELQQRHLFCNIFFNGTTSVQVSWPLCRSVGRSRTRFFENPLKQPPSAPPPVRAAYDGSAAMAAAIRSDMAQVERQRRRPGRRRSSSARERLVAGLMAEASGAGGVLVVVASRSYET